MELKKTPKADLSRKSGLFFNVGLAISLIVVLTAFEYRTYDDTSLIEFDHDAATFDDEIIPPTNIPPPPPPPIQAPPTITEVEDDVEIDDIEINVDIEVTNETVVDEIQIIEVEAPKEDPDKIFLVVEEGAEPKGGIKEFYKYVSKRLEGHYPAQARRMGIEGRVFVGFVVNRDGSIVDVNIVKGIGAGCDDLAKKIIEESPAWKPGKQRGIPVRQKMVIQIVFNLN
jgi:protein TonB